MEAWISPLYSAIIVLAFSFIPVLLIIGAIKWHQKIYRRKAISPLSAGRLREAGHSLRIKFEDQQLDAMGYFSSLIFLSVYPLAYIGAGALLGKDFYKPSLMMVPVLFLLFLAPKIFRLFQEARNTRLGLEAEIVCGQELDQLMREGWHVFHDIPADKSGGKFNIDHVLIGPSGVYAVETKGRRKPLTKDGKKQYEAVYWNGYIEFPQGRDRQTLKQAKRNAQYVSGWLSKACGFKIEAIPVLLFPGWYFENAVKPPFPLGNPKGVISYIKSSPNKFFDEQQCKQIAYQVEQAARLPNEAVNQK